jgi:hypothetical protein
VWAGGECGYASGFDSPAAALGDFMNILKSTAIE